MRDERVIGIVCECNPFHGGHQYLIRRARESGAEVIVCVMSGCFVQRGEAAVAAPYLRAEAILRGGADLVLELPFPWAASTAESFSRAGVDVLSRVGVSELWFGSECGDLSILRRAAEICSSPEFAARYAQSTSENRGTAQAYFELLTELAGSELSLSSNDILGVSYLRAIASLGADLLPVTVQREGSAYRETELSQVCAYPSASALRQLWRREGISAVLPHLPKECRNTYSAVEKPADLTHAERLILGTLRLCDPAALESVAELSGGLGNRLAQAAHRAQSLEELLTLAATKKYPQARLQRGILFALTRVTQGDLHAPIAYTRLLGATRRGCEYLSEHRKLMEISVVTRKTELPETPAAQAQAELESRAWALWSLCHPDAKPSDTLWKGSPRILGE